MTASGEGDVLKSVLLGSDLSIGLKTMRLASAASTPPHLAKAPSQPAVASIASRRSCQSVSRSGDGQTLRVPRRSRRPDRRPDGSRCRPIDAVRGEDPDCTGFRSEIGSQPGHFGELFVATEDSTAIAYRNLVARVAGVAAKGFKQLAHKVFLHSAEPARREGS
jgi:hypothetical protein